VHLINGSIGKAGHSNNLYDCILAVAQNTNVIAQCAVLCMLWHTVFCSYRAHSGRLNQWDCCAIDCELLRVMTDLHANPKAIHELPWIQAPTRLISSFVPTKPAALFISHHPRA
jgi:hypothetical protein